MPRECGAPSILCVEAMCGGASSNARWLLGRPHSRAMTSPRSLHHLLRSEPVDLRCREAEASHHFLGVLAQQRRAAAHAARRRGEPHRHPGNGTLLLAAGMIELDHHVAGAKMRIGDDVAHVEYRAE